MIPAPRIVVVLLGAHRKRGAPRGAAGEPLISTLIGSCPETRRQRSPPQRVLFIHIKARKKVFLRRSCTIRELIDP